MTEAVNRILALTIQIVTAYLDANTVATPAVPGLIRDVNQSLSSVERSDSRKSGLRETRRAAAPAVDIRKSVFSNHLICLEDGKQVTMLKRHLKTAHGLTPEQYRTKWDLPARYPMVAPNYAKMRSKLAKQMGLGRTQRSAFAVDEMIGSTAPFAAERTRNQDRATGYRDILTLEAFCGKKSNASHAPHFGPPTLTEHYATKFGVFPPPCANRMMGVKPASGVACPKERQA